MRPGQVQQSVPMVDVVGGGAQYTATAAAEAVPNGLLTVLSTQAHMVSSPHGPPRQASMLQVAPPSFPSSPPACARAS